MKITSLTLTAAAAAAAYVISGASVLGHSLPDQHWGTRGAIVDAVGAAAFAFTALAVSGLRPRLTDTRSGVWAARVAQFGLAGMTVESVASLIHGGNTLGAVFFGGLVLTIAGLAVLAVAGVRADRMRWVAPLPVLGLVLGIAGGDHGGFLVTGVVWLAIAMIVNARDVQLVAA
jgi:hypothetical protein